VNVAVPGGKVQPVPLRDGWSVPDNKLTIDLAELEKVLTKKDEDRDIVRKKTD